MIAPEFEKFLRQQISTFLTPAENLAVVIDSHPISHAKLLLSQMTYSRVPVVTSNHIFLGTLGLNDIARYQVIKEIDDEELDNHSLIEVIDKSVSTISPQFQLEDVFHDLIDASFLPVVDENGKFEGIITRKSILKAVNHLLHDFTESYEIKSK